MKDWTMMVYMAADNNLAAAAEANLFEMLTAGSGERIDVVVQYDRRQDSTIRYHVEPGYLKTIDTLPGTNTGDPDALSQFISWARQTYPARHTLLVIWGHGTGWADVPSDFPWDSIRDARTRKVLSSSLFRTTVGKARTLLSGARAVALDATSRDFLDNDELRKGLADGLAGDTLDVLGFDGCLMAMLEIAYHLRDQARFVVASQEVEFPLGWPYASILDALNESPELGPRELSQIIVEAYGQSAHGMRGPTKYTQSALDLAQVSTTFSLVQRLAQHLTAAYPEDLYVRRAVNEASGQRRGAKRFRDDNSVDLYDWAWCLRPTFRPPFCEFRLFDLFGENVFVDTPSRGDSFRSNGEATHSTGSGNRFDAPKTT